MKLGDYVWYQGTGWLYHGQLEDGEIMLARPMHKHPFKILETAYVCVEDMEEFYKENGGKI